MTTIEINGKEYNVEIAKTEEEKEVGLQGKEELKENEGMLFVYDEPQEISFWMKDTDIPLDIIFIDEYGEVISVAKGEPNTEDAHTENDVKYVLELNQDSGIKKGDDVDLSEVEDLDIEESDEDNSEADGMVLLDADGNIQMPIEGGERIFSRPHTRILVRLAKKAYKSKQEKDYKALGKKLFSILNIQNNQKPEYV